MTLKLANSGELVTQVFWLDLRHRTCGVMLRAWDGSERCAELPLASLSGDCLPHMVEILLGDRTAVILRDDG